MIDTNEHIYSTNEHIYKNKDNAITKDIKYAPKLFNKDVNEYKKDVLFSIVYNKNDILYRKTLIDKSTVNKSNLLITPIPNDWNNNFIDKKKTKIYPLEENNIITYKSIADKFIYYYILYNKWGISNHVKFLDLGVSSGLIEVLLHNKIKCKIVKYLFNDKYILVDNKINDNITKLKKLYKIKDSTITYNNEYKDDVMNINKLETIIKDNCDSNSNSNSNSNNNNNYNLLFIDTTIHLEKYVKEEQDYNDYSYLELLHKLYLGLNLLDNNGKCILNFRSNIGYKHVMKNLLYFLLLFFDVEYKSVIRYNTDELLLNNFNKEKFNNQKEFFKSVINELDEKCMKDILFKCNSNTKKIITESNYDFSNLFMVKKYDEKYNIFFEHVYDEINRISYKNEILKLAKKDLCPKLEKCFTIEQLLSLNYKNFLNNLGNNISILQKYNLIVNPKYIKLDNEYNKEIVNYNLNMCFNTIVSLSMDDIGTSKEGIGTSKGINNELNLLKFYIESRNVEKWYYITMDINIRKYITNYISQKYNIKVSRAFCKMYDILTQFPLIDLTKSKVKTFHACEAPGHFINAFNYWIKSRNKDYIYDWVANSLNPSSESNRKKYGNIFSDQYGFIKRHKERWDWGKDNTGDISSKSNLLYYESKYKNQNIDIYTSDCGLSANEDFEQESSLSFLSISQLLLGLMILKIGGSAVCKVFIPFTKPLTISILYIYTLYFEKVHIIKQASGSLGSSEVYIVGINKKEHLSETIKNKLFDVLENMDMDKMLFTSSQITDNFISKVNEVSYKFIDMQKKYLFRSFYYYDNPDILEKHKKEHFGKAKYKYAEQWIFINKFKMIDSNLKL
jgi:hypothetical protein